MPTGAELIKMSGSVPETSVQDHRSFRHHYIGKSFSQDKKIASKLFVQGVQPVITSGSLYAHFIRYHEL